ncbi:MAG: four helix bundle protein [Sphingobacteriales bacterium]|nr:four helix bundle protein [Sphingobacteriales bacterium]
MPTIQKFEDLQIWQKARLLSQKVYPITYKEPVSTDYRLRDQIRGSCGSIMDNIAEGFERGGKNEFKNALSIAKGETGELKSQLYRCLDNKYIPALVFEELYSLADELTRMITGFINYLNQSGIRGQKFKTRSKDE